MSMKIFVAGIAAVAGLSWLSSRGSSSSLAEILDWKHIPSPGVDVFESKLFQLKRRMLRGDLPAGFDMDRWLDQNWPKEVASEESWGKTLARQYLESPIMGPASFPLANATSDIRGAERGKMWNKILDTVEEARQGSYASLGVEQ